MESPYPRNTALAHQSLLTYAINGPHQHQHHLSHVATNLLLMLSSYSTLLARVGLSEMQSSIKWLSIEISSHTLTPLSDNVGWHRARMNLVDSSRAMAPRKAWMCWTGYHATRYLQTKKVTYPRYTVDIYPEKSKPNQTQITAGGDQLDYHGNVSTHTASMETIKTHWNSVVSTPNTRYCTGDISNM